MKYVGNKVEDIKIAYIGGGSRGWAWGFMSDLVSAEDISGSVYLYDIDIPAAKNNEIIGNRYNNVEGAKTHWDYKAVDTIDKALDGADFVIISILPGTFDEMASDVHTPEKYGIYQSVGDTSGPGGIVRAMRCLPMYEGFAENIKKYCPNAWVINYTNPMTLCVRALYKTFPEIKAFGCCHEVFGTQRFLERMVREDIDEAIKDFSEVKVNPVAINHFTWLTEAKWRNIDLFPYYKEFCKKYVKDGYGSDEEGPVDNTWMNSAFKSKEVVKMDLFNRYGYIAAAGDRHLAEFCEGKWYLESPEKVAEYKFGLTDVDYRKNDLKKRLARADRLISGEEALEIAPTGEEGVEQIRALLGLTTLVTNVNIPNLGQIPNLPIDAVVETNAVFRGDSLTPVFAGEVPQEIYPMVQRICSEQEVLADGIQKRDLTKIFGAFANDPLVTCSLDDAKKLFKEMCENTKEYLTMYNLDELN